MNPIRLSVPFGDTSKICIHVVDSDNEPLDLSLYAELTFRLKRSTQDADSVALFLGTKTAGDITILNPSNDGVCETVIPKASVSSMRIGAAYYWNLKVTNGTGQESTAAYGTFFIESPILK